MRNIKILLAASAIVFAINSSAMALSGHEYIIDEGGGVYTFIFDKIKGSNTIPNDLRASALTFSEFGVDLTVTGGLSTASKRIVQDKPRHGGLGVDPPDTPDPFGDNMGGGEWLDFTFTSTAIDLVGISFNGLMNSDGHKNKADGMLGISAFGNPLRSLDAAKWQNTGSGLYPDISATFNEFAGISSFRVATTATNNSWHGYVESITIRAIPEPTTMLLFGTGIAGLAAVCRRRRK